MGGNAARKRQDSLGTISVATGGPGRRERIDRDIGHDGRKEE